MAKRKPLFFFLLLIPVSCIVCGVSLLGAFGYMDYCGFPGASVSLTSQLAQVEIGAENAAKLTSVMVFTGDERQELDFSADGRWLIVTGRTSNWISPFQDFRDGVCASVWIIDLEALNAGGQGLRVLHQYMETLIGPSFGLSIDPTSKFAVFGNRQVISIETGTSIATLDTRVSRYINNMAFSPNGQYLIASDGIAGAIWSTRDFSLLHTILASPSSQISRELVAFVDQDTMIVSSDEEPLRLWNVVSGEEDGTVPLEVRRNFEVHDVNAAQHLIAYQTFFPDSLYVAKVEAEQSWLVSQEPAKQLTFSPSGNLMAVAFADRIAIYVVANSEMISTMTDSNTQGRVTEMTFNSSEDVLALGRDNGNVDIISLSGQLLASLRGDSFKVTDLAFNPAGTLLAVSTAQDGANLGGVWIWQIDE